MMVTSGAAQHTRELLDRLCAVAGVLNAVVLQSDGVALKPHGEPALRTLAGDAVWAGQTFYQTSTPETWSGKVAAPDGGEPSSTS